MQIGWNLKNEVANFILSEIMAILKQNALLLKSVVFLCCGSRLKLKISIGIKNITSKFILGPKYSIFYRKKYFRKNRPKNAKTPHGFTKLALFRVFCGFRVVHREKLQPPSTINFFPHFFNIIYLPKKF